MEWLNHIVELVLCCSSKKREKRLDYHDWDTAIDVFTAGVTALQEHSIVVVLPSSFWVPALRSPTTEPAAHPKMGLRRFGRRLCPKTRAKKKSRSHHAGSRMPRLADRTFR